MVTAQQTKKLSYCRVQTHGQRSLISLLERNTFFCGEFRFLELKVFRQGSYIQRYPIVAMEDTFYIFGGDSGPSNETPSNTIAAFSTVTKEWKKLGELNQARLGHGVFIQQGDFIVVGGWENLRTEHCTLNQDAIRCTLINPELDYYYYYPEMMAVNPDYCTLNYVYDGSYNAGYDYGGYAGYDYY